MSDRWRCFVACPIDESLRIALVGAAAGWMSHPGVGTMRWTDPDSWHLTLAFLGDTDPDKVGGIQAALIRASAAHAPARVRAGGLGAFPSPGRARVLWYGIADRDGALARLARDIRTELGLDTGLPFRPHLTVARASGGSVDLSDWLNATATPDETLTVDRVDLMRSHLGSGPARYEILASSSLGAFARV